MSSSYAPLDPVFELGTLATEEENLAARKAAVIERAKGEIPTALERLAALCKAAGPVTRRQLIELGIIEKRDDETVKRPKRVKAEKAAAESAG